jgi:hypothetical protein
MQAADGRALSLAPGDGWRVQLALPVTGAELGLLTRSL